MKSFAVIGLGRFGTRIAKSLYENGEYVIAIDTSSELVEQIADSVSRAIVVDAKNKNELKKLGIPDCDYAIVALGSNLASSILITMNLKSLGVKNVICKAHDETHREILEKIGADKVIIPEFDAAEKTAGLLTSPNFLDYIELSDECGLIKIAPPKPWIGKTLRELNLRERFHVNLIAVTENGKLEVAIPSDKKISDSQILTFLGEYKSLDRIKRIE